ncbi:MAG: L-lactate permease [Chloroflexota bacterium]|nr:L-lactate permease [Chloroflexota bacterium]
MAGPDLTLLNWLLAAAPIALLVLAIMRLRWSAPRAGGLSWLAAAALALWVFGNSYHGVAIASAKGLSLALFVLTILWASVYMYNLVDRTGGIDAIGRAMARAASDPLTQALLIAWGFASFIQGITGFGVPVAVAAPLLMMMGFAPARAAAMVLVGHGWAVTFGSMGSSYYTIQLVTGIPGEEIGPHMALLFAPVTIASGMLVAHIHGGLRAVWRSLPLVVVVGGAMAAAMWLMADLGAPQIASSVPGLIALAAIPLGARAGLVRPERAAQAEDAPAVDAAPAAEGRRMSFHLGFMPYYLLIGLSVLSQLAPVRDAALNLSWGLDYPGFVTETGHVVAPAADYAAIRLLNHPAPLIIVSVAASMAMLALAGFWKRGAGWEAARLTYSQSLSTTVGVGTMVMMAVVMADTGLTALLAQGIAKASGPLFPFVSPFIGALGSFMTGSNTNSNVLFGVLQIETARSLGIGQVTIASMQSIGASVGSSMAPAKVLVGAALVGLAGREHVIMRLTVPYVLALVAIAGLTAIILIELVPRWTR